MSDTNGTETVGADTAGTEVTSTEVTGTEALGTEATGTEATGTDITRFAADVVETDLPDLDADSMDLATTDLTDGAANGIDEPATEQDLVDEGDIAADYIEELLDIADIDGDLDIDARAGRAYVSVTASEGANLRLLSRPDTVTALQELTRLAVQNRTGRFSRLILDVGGSRDARAEELAALVDHAIGRLEAGAATASLPPMSSYERKLVHDIVADRGFSSESEGEGKDRHTVIRPA